ncbi:hypothetical protein CLU79DRAFT_830691 [Phycomyces nitens]|nr:hypothetical protein CLU79DRAFT_830691 [Phycomyces nitens]
MAAWARTINTISVVFNVGKIASDDELCELMVQKLGPVVFLEISAISPIRPLHPNSLADVSTHQCWLVRRLYPTIVPAKLSALSITFTTPADSASPTTPPNITIPSPQQDENIDIPKAGNVTNTPAANYTTKVITVREATVGMSKKQKDAWIYIKITAGEIDELMPDSTGTPSNSSKYSCSSRGIRATYGTFVSVTVPVDMSLVDPSEPGKPSSK